MIHIEVGTRFDWTSLPWLRDLLSRVFLVSVPPSGDKLWSDILKVAVAFLTFSTLSITVAHASLNRVPEGLLDRLRAHDVIRKYRLLPPLNVWLMLNVPFSMALAWMCTTGLVAAILCGLALLLATFTIGINYQLLADHRRTACLAGVASCVVVIGALASRLLAPGASYSDNLAMPLAVVWLFLGIGIGIAATYWADTPHANLRIGHLVRSWHSEEKNIVQTGWEQLRKQYEYYLEQHRDGNCHSVSGLRERIILLRRQQEDFCGFTLEGEGISLFELKPLIVLLEAISTDIPRLTAELKELLNIEDKDTGEDPFLAT